MINELIITLLICAIVHIAHAPAPLLARTTYTVRSKWSPNVVVLAIKACKILIILQDVVALIIKAGLSWRFSPAEIQGLTPSTATAMGGLVWALSS